MADKKSRLLERATATVRQPRPDRLLETSDKKKGYRVVAVSLYTPEAEWIDYITQVLQRAGNPKANRSLVIRGYPLKAGHYVPQWFQAPEAAASSDGHSGRF
jgi:hypothetical protein